MSFYPNRIHQNAMAYCVANNVIIIPELIKKNEIRLNIRIKINKLKIVSHISWAHTHMPTWAHVGPKPKLGQNGPGPCWDQMSPGHTVDLII